MVPAFTGLGSPYWNPHARGMISGLTRGTRREHIVRAALEGIAHSIADVVEQMQPRGKGSIKELKVDGGATGNGFLMQYQADLLGLPVAVSDIAESTAWGAAKLAARVSGFWPSLSGVDRCRKYRRYFPRMKRQQASTARGHWKNEIRRLLSDPAYPT